MSLLDRPDTPGTWWERAAQRSPIGEALLAVDWSATGLGPPASWPAQLRTAVEICLTTRFPMLVCWGPELRMIYNDGYREMIGDKHPGALGQPMREVWHEIIDVIGPMLDEVIGLGTPTWAEHQRLLISRQGFVEETYFTFSYSALRDEHGDVAGVLDIATETTSEVIAQRQLQCLTDLSVELFDAAGVVDACVRATRALQECSSDVADADLLLAVDADLLPISSTRRFGAASAVPVEQLRRVLESGCPGPIAVSSHGRTERSLAVPMVGAVDGVVHIVPSPMRRFDAGYERFLEAVADTIASAIRTSFRRSVEVGEQRRISDALQTAMLRPASDHPTIAARYRPASPGLAVGGDWYDVIDVSPNRRALVVGDCVGHGLEAATTMGQLRSAARVLLLEGHDPAVVLEQLDVFASATDGGLATTVACTIVDRIDRVITYARAGHPPPLMVRADRSIEWLDEAGGPPLQAGGVSMRRSASVPYTPGDLLLLFSDGLYERRYEHPDVGLARLSEAVVELFDSDVHDLADRILDHMLTPDRTDDVVLVAKRLVSAVDERIVD